MACILALDQGTSSCRSLLIDQEGKIVASAQKEFRQHFPLPGLVEHDAEEIWQCQKATIIEVLSKTKAVVKGIGITNQRETTLIWNKKTGKPLYRAIVWQDRRTAPLCDLMKSDDLEVFFRDRTGLFLDPYFSGTKLHWLLQDVPGAKQEDVIFGTMDTWLVWNLTGGKVHITDRTNASRTLLYNIREKKWDEELAALLQIPLSVLPKVASSSEVYGECVLKELEGVPICGIAGDQQAALFGQKCFAKGDTKCTYGTGCFLLQNIGEKAVIPKEPLLVTIGIDIPGKTDYALEGSVFAGGALVQWLRDQLHLIEKSGDIEKLAASVKDSGGVVFVPAFTGLGAPYWDPYARGAIMGLSRSATDAHIARAGLEGIAYQVSDITDLLHSLNSFKVDGGAANNDLLMQIQADLLQKPIQRMADHEMTALGAAYLAGLAVGFWKNTEEIANLERIDQTFFPKQKRSKERWKKAVACVQEWERMA